MATLEQMERALVNADAAGDVNAARTLAAAIKAARGDRANLIPGNEVSGTRAAEAPPTMGEKALGTGEAALALGTGLTGGTLGLVGGWLKSVADQLASGADPRSPEAGARAIKAAQEGAQSLTYAPRTPAGQEQTAAAVEALQGLVPMTGLTGELALAAGGAKAAIPPAVATTQRGAQAVQGAAQAVREKVIPQARGSAGAAAVPADVVRVQKAGNLPVPVRMTQGAASRDADQLSFEKEQMKGPLGAPLRARAEENNLQALQNFDALIDDTGAISPDVAATGTALTKALSKGYEAAKNKTRAAYKAAENSAEALIDVDAAPLIEALNNTPSGLKTTAITDHAKQYAQRLGVARADADGKLVALPTNVKTMEALRKEISQATGYDPVDIAQSTALKKLIDTTTEPVAGPFYQKARAERTAQARKYENRAIVARLVNNKRGMDDPAVSVDQVFQKSILNSSPEEITFLKRVLKTTGKQGNDAWNELEAQTMKYIRDEATKGMGMDSADNAIVSPAKLHAVVTQLDKNGRLDLMLGKQRAQTIRDLNEVVRYVNTVPPGTLINSSGTAGMLMAAIAEAGATGALTGLPVPVLTGLRMVSKGVKSAKTKARIKAALGE